MFQGEAIVVGGLAKQKINNLTIRLFMNVFLQKGNISKKIAHIALMNRECICPNEHKVIPFDFVIPKNMPVTRGRSPLFLIRIWILKVEWTERILMN